MTITAHPQQRYDHRLRDLVHRTGDVTIATALGVPRSTARGCLHRAPEVVVSLDVTDLSEPELQQEIVKLRRRVQMLAALLQLVLALLRASGFTLSRERLPDGCAKVIVPPTITQAVSQRRTRSSLRACTSRRVNQIGRRRWKKESRYHRQAPVENAFFRYKSIIGDRLRARHSKAQDAEASIACNIPNRMTELGRPASFAIGR